MSVARRETKTLLRRGSLLYQKESWLSGQSTLPAAAVAKGQAKVATQFVILLINRTNRRYNLKPFFSIEVRLGLTTLPYFWTKIRPRDPHFEIGPLRPKHFNLTAKGTPGITGYISTSMLNCWLGPPSRSHTQSLFNFSPHMI